MSQQHIIYIPGLGDKYDPLRRLCLMLWRRRNTVVTHVAMNWQDVDEPYETKLKRVGEALERYPDRATTIVGESAGGAVVVGAFRRFPEKLARVVTVCGMNRGAANVSPHLYRRNPAFHDAMQLADQVILALTPEEAVLFTTLYSSLDFTVRPKNTQIDGATAIDLNIPGHMPAIFSVLLWQYRRFLI